MTRFLLDEDLPKSLATLLNQNGISAESSEQAGLRSRPDPEVFAYACRTGRALITRDHGFANLLRFPLGTHPGILIASYSWKVPAKTFGPWILAAIRGLAPEDITGNLIILEESRVRLKKAEP